MNLRLFFKDDDKQPYGRMLLPLIQVHVPHILLLP